jgi:hypothetical protein
VSYLEEITLREGALAPSHVLTYEHKEKDLYYEIIISEVDAWNEDYTPVDWEQALKAHFKSDGCVHWNFGAKYEDGYVYTDTHRDIERLQTLITWACKRAGEKLPQWLQEG